MPAGTFRVVSLLKNDLLAGSCIILYSFYSLIVECIGTGVVIVGETRRLIASLPQDVTDLFTHRFTFGMMEESCRFK